MDSRAPSLRLSSDSSALLPEPDARWIDSEWLETDGLSGYACSTALGLATRRYHGWLLTVPDGRVQRHLFLSRFDETLRIDNEVHELGVGRYGDELSPRGFEHLQSFDARPWPTWTFEAGGARLRRELLLRDGRRTLLVRYTLTGASAPPRLELRPLFPFREADHLTYANDVLDSRVEPLADGLRHQPYRALPAVELRWGDARVETVADPTWYKGITYAQDRARGYEALEDHASPVRLLWEVEGESANPAARATTPLEHELVIAVGLDPLEASPVELWRRETEARALRAPEPTGALELARLSSRAYFYSMPVDEPDRGCAPSPASGPARPAETAPPSPPSTTRTGILAGFPWFGEWGRDVFIALPGLTLARGRVDECEAVLCGALPFLSGGLLPNIYGRRRGDSHYGSADASLWFARAVRLWAARGGDRELLHDAFLPALEEIVAGYSDSEEGRALGLFVDDEGLLHAGRPDLNPTWMDAQVEAGPVTPRAGMPIELNALWYGLLATLEELHQSFRNMSQSREFGDRRRLAKRHFLPRFWVEDEGYLADLVREDGTIDLAVRPNMVLAAAEGPSPLRRKDRQAIVDVAREQLLTPVGLRTLSPADPAYVGRYEGGPEERDGAYHQGTVWPWLLGFYTEAALRAYGSKRNQRDELAELWLPLEAELSRGGLGHLAEVYDGDAPHRPGGTFAQAWSLAEYLRAKDLLTHPLR